MTMTGEIQGTKKEFIKIFNEMCYSRSGCSPIGEVKIVLEEVFVLRKNRNVKSRTIEVKIQ